MHILLTATLFILAVFCLINFIINVTHTRPTREEYLRVLSYDTWKSYEEIVIELEKLKGKKIAMSHVLVDMQELKIKGVVEEQPFDEVVNGKIKHISKFRKKHGRQKKVIPVRLPDFDPLPLPA